jgi:peptide/nickel transport system permease protein
MLSMGVYILRRFLYSILLIFFSLSLIFFLVSALPGSPFDRMRADMAARRSSLAPIIPDSHWARLEALLGLDRPLHERYFAWIQNMVTGDLGTSWSVNFGASVVDIIFSRLPYTLLLLFVSVLFSFLAAIPLGLYSALNPYSEGDFLLTFLSFFGMCMPTFWIGSLLLSTFSIGLDWLPYSGVVTQSLIDKGDIIKLLGRVLSLGNAYPQMAGYEFEILWDGLKHLILPTFALSLYSIARWSRYMRSSVLEVLRQDYVTTARAKGLPKWRVISRHVIRNSLVPIITILALDIPVLFTGSFVTEVVFSWPGLGRLFMDSMRQNDSPMLMGLLVIFTYLIIFSNFFADILHAGIDPRIKQSLLNDR